MTLEHSGINPEQHKSIQENMKIISDAAQKIYHLLPPGGCMTIVWLVQPPILTRDAQPERHTMMINKPLFNLEATVKVKP